jgi:hypothetical protein
MDIQASLTSLVRGRSSKRRVDVTMKLVYRKELLLKGLFAGNPSKRRVTGGADLYTKPTGE